MQPLIQLIVTGDEAQAFRSFDPLIPGKLLHVHGHIRFVDYLYADKTVDEANTDQDDPALSVILNKVEVRGYNIK